jgi:hypothetical protein
MAEESFKLDEIVKTKTMAKEPFELAETVIYYLETGKIDY